MASAIILLIRKDRLHPLYTLWWFIAALCIGLLGLFPSIADLVGKKLGIAYPPIFVLIVANIMLFFKILLMDIERTENKKQIRKLSQTLAVLKHEIERLRKKAG
jgi:hypothetical protein